MLRCISMFGRLGLVFGLVGILSGCGFGPLYKSTRDLNEKHIPGTGIRVTTANGAITVKRSLRDDIEILAHIRAASQERADEAEIFTERTTSGTLNIRVDWPDGSRWNREGCSFDILVPDANDVYLRTSNGQLQVVGLGGKADLRTSNGTVTLEDHTGDADVDTSNGRVKLTNVTGAINAESSNGSITITKAGDFVKARTSNGQIRTILTDDNKGPVDLRTSNGSIHVELGTAFSGRLGLRTSNNRLYLDNFPNAKIASQSKRRAELVFGNSGSESRIRTSNGSIRVQALGR